MNIIRLPLSEVKRPERNVRIHTEKQLQEFSRSIKMFGQIRPIVIDEDNTILAGVGCYETMLRMRKPDADFYRVEGLTENQKKKLMITDNKIFGLGIDDLDTFNTFLDELKHDLDIPGYDEEILRSMVAAADEVSEKISGYGAMDEDEIADIIAARGRKDAKMLAPASVPASDGATAEPPAESAAEVKKFVTCPKCGEKICL